MAKKKSKLKKQNIIIFVNILILLIITCFYAYRLVHFYKIDHPKALKSLNLVDTITLKKNVTKIGDGLYKEDNNYLFKGTFVNNYLKYSGYLFRIVSVDENKNIKLITDDSLTNLAWGIDLDYDSSYVKSWLSGEKSNEGIFYSSLNNPLDYLVDTNFCTQIVNKNSKECKNNETSSVGLLSLVEYINAGGKKSFLNKDDYWWLSNPSKEGIWHVLKGGKIDDVSNLGKEYYSYGVRPVITIKGDISLISGDGTKDNPYIIENKTDNILKLKNVGDYIKYSDLNWRIIEKNNEYIRVALDGFIGDERIYSNSATIYSTSNNIGYYLNTTFYNSLDKTHTVTGNVYTNRYDSTVDFDYLKIFDNEIKANVGMMQVGDLFMNDYDNYFLVSRTSTYVGTVYKVLNDNKLYADLPNNKANIRPTIFLDLESKINSGDGTKDNPYIIG